MSMLDFDRQDFDAQILKMKAQFEAKKEATNAALVTAVTNSCAAIEATSKKLVNEAVVDVNKTYGKRGHHPSVPGSAFASDNGNALRSITHEVTVKSKTHVEGKTGSTITNPPYPSYLETGTSKLKPRPWLQPSLDQNMDYIKEQFKKVPNA